MLKVRYLVAMSAALLQLTPMAEITGSGFHELGCSGAVSAKVWLDANANGVLDATEHTLPGAKLLLYREDSPELGTGEIFTGANGDNSFDSLCDGAFILRLDTTTTPPETQHDHLYRDLQVPDLDVEVQPAQWRVNVQSMQNEAERLANNSHLELALRPSSCDVKVRAGCCLFDREGVPQDNMCGEPAETVLK